MPLQRMQADRFFSFVLPDLELVLLGVKVYHPLVQPVVMSTMQLSRRRKNFQETYRLCIICDRVSTENPLIQLN